MSKIKIKQIATSLVLGIFISLQIAPSVLAATDQEAAASAEQGIEYQKDNQNDDGSIAGFGGETEWTIIAVKAAGEDPATVDNGSGNSLEDFLASDAPAVDAPATTIERKILAVAATGNDTSNFGGYNYNEKLKTYHNNNQIGETTLLNDDIFGIIAIKATNDDSLKSMAQDGLDYLLANQGSDGGFSYTTVPCPWCGSDSNDTAAAIISFDAAEKMGLSNPNLSTGKDAAIVYLLSTQNDDGGFGYDIFSPSDGSSTSWALMALNVIGDAVKTQALKARDWLIANQNPDGGFRFGAYDVNDSDTYTTAHAIIALFGTSWLLDPAPRAATATTPATSPDAPPEKDANSNTAPVASSNQNIIPPANGTNQKSENKVAASNSATSSSKTAGNAPNTPGINFGVYGIGLLGLIAISYFVIESLKARRVKA